uniref:Major facilitator superfamily (MFS) profile domain-containing protein n=1 Tax=Bionectria ochroleuca TaxID=29856 RepID=A0A0B7JVF2_BIOOC
MAIGDDSPRDHHPEEKSAEGTASSDGPIETAEWDLKVEARARRKIDSSVLLLLFLGLLVFQLDRMNLASALTGGFATDIKVTQDTINLGNQLMFMGIVVLEIPCNMALQRLGPRKWISGQVFVFGLVATLQLLLKNRTGFLVSRLVLGLAEAGYIPGAIYTLSTWYTKRELAKRVAVLFFGMFGGNALSPLLASGILKLDGSRGLRGWQWLFLLEGLFTICVSFLLLLFLPGSPDIPKPLIGRGLVKFSSEDKKVLQSRLEADDLGKHPGAQGLLIDWKLVWSTVSHYRRWPHYVSTFAVFSTWSPLTTYTPSIIMSLGFERITANALASVGAFIALLVVFAFAYISDRTGYRGGSVILAHVCYLIVLITARQAHPHVGKWSRWGLWTAVNSFAVGYHPVHNTWVQLNCVDAGERSIAIAMWVMSAISGLMVGTQYFRANDTPFYQTGLRTMIIMVSVGMAFAIIQVLVYRIHNKRLAKRGAQEQGRSVQLYTI